MIQIVKLKERNQNQQFNIIHPKQTNNVEYCQIKTNKLIGLDCENE